MTDETLRGVLTDREYQDYAFGYRENVNDTHLPQIRSLPDILPGLFADAAAIAKRAGFDGGELHFAHAYTMAGLLSRLNMHEDGYDGSPENRVRLPIEVLRKARESVGADYCLGLRLLGDEVIEDGSRVDDAAFYSLELARAGATRSDGASSRTTAKASTRSTRPSRVSSGTGSSRKVSPERAARTASGGRSRRIDRGYFTFTPRIFFSNARASAFILP